jgi:DNA-binding NtrC family response regulator
VQAARFREDLFYRLHVFPIAVPPLRERPEDVAELVRHFLVRFCAEEGKTIRMVSGEAMSLLARHDWPGNVRQLENAVFRAVVLAENDTIGLEEFPQIATQSPAGTPAAHGSFNHDACLSMLADAPAMIVEPDHQQGPAWTEGGLPLLDPEGQVRPLEDVEADVIRFAIAHYRGQMSEVARRLRIGRSTLYRKLEGLGFEETGERKRAPSVAAE